MERFNNGVDKLNTNKFHTLALRQSEERIAFEMLLLYGSEAFWSFFPYWVWFFFVLNFLLGIARQWSREKFAILTLKP